MRFFYAFIRSIAIVIDKIILNSIIIVLSNQVLASNTETIHLFDPQRGKKVEQVVKTPLKPPIAVKTSRPKINIKSKEFVLQGISHIGKQYRVILQAPNKKQIVVKWQEGTTSTIPEYKEYTLVMVKTKKVKLAYPGGGTCSKSKPEKGIECIEKGKYALLTLTQQKGHRPIQRNKVVNAKKSTDVSEAKKVVTKKSIPNLFERMLHRNKEETPAQKKRRQAAEKRRKERYKKYQAKRIKAEDVPPGMKVVRTPFGDRLVPK